MSVQALAGERAIDIMSRFADGQVLINHEGQTYIAQIKEIYYEEKDVTFFRIAFEWVARREPCGIWAVSSAFGEGVSSTQIWRQVVNWRLVSRNSQELLLENERNSSLTMLFMVAGHKDCVPASETREL